MPTRQRPSRLLTRGFAGFSRGTMGNAGQNLYVSRRGILQRIHLFDLDRDGHIELLFCNAQDHNESPPALVYHHPLSPRRRTCRELPAEGAVAAAAGDLNGDGFDELVLGMLRNGATDQLHAYIYFGGPEGLTRKYQMQLPAPACSSVAIGDFNGDGKPDLAFACCGKLRLFYQGPIGFEPKRYVELDVPAQHLAAADLDGDGCCDLYVVGPSGAQPRVLWGKGDGLSAARGTAFPLPVERIRNSAGSAAQELSAEENTGNITAQARIITLAGTPHLFFAQQQRALLIPVLPRRRWGKPRVFPVLSAHSVAAGDLSGNGRQDLVFAAQEPRPAAGRRTAKAQCSWIYWADRAGRHWPRRRTQLPSERAVDVTVADLDGDGRQEIVLCQHRSGESYDVESPIYRAAPGAPPRRIARLPSPGSRQVLTARTGAEELPQLIFVNQFAGNAVGRISPTIYFGGKNGFTPQRAQHLHGLGTVAALGCDLNDDSRPDLILANCAENAIHLDEGSAVHLAGPRGLPADPSYRLPTHTAMAMAVADLNRDGYLDVIFSGFGHSRLLIFRGTPGGLDTKNPQIIEIADGDQPFIEGRRMCLADFNNDGYLDLVVSDKAQDRCFVLWGGPDGFDFRRKQTLSVLRSSSPVAADLTGSGYLDLIIGGHQTSAAGPYDSFLYIYWNGPDGLREDRRTQLPAAAVLGVAVADFNKDGHLDIFIPNYHDGRGRDVDSLLYWGGPDGQFHPERVTRLRTHSAAGCLAADFDEDGRIDLAVANHKTFGNHIGESFVFWNGKEGFSPQRMTRLPTSGPHGIMNMGQGNQRDRGPEEHYQSEVFELPKGARPTRITWQAQLGPKTWVHAQVRSAASAQELATAPWRGPRGKDTWFTRSGSALPARLGGSFLQYRLALGAINSGSTPRVREVAVEYR